MAKARSQLFVSSAGLVFQSGLAGVKIVGNGIR